MRRSIFSQADRVVSEDEDRRNLRQRRQPHAGPHVIAEIEKRCAERADPGHDQPIYTRAHSMLTHAEMQISSSILARLKITRILQRGLV